VDPTLDVDGYDAKYKLQILTGHSYGVFTRPHDVLNFGIRYISKNDFKLARELNAKIKLIAHVGKISDDEVALYVTPQLITAEHLLYNVENEYNGVIVEASFSDKQLFIGKGAGGNPTGSAVLSDISAGSYEYKYEYKKNTQRKYSFTNNVNVFALISGAQAASLRIKNVALHRLENDSYYIQTSLDTLIKSKEEIEAKGIFVTLVADAALQEKILSKVIEEVI
ncbi:MAG TPA: homoserine dehydrogenase, partial [Flavobacteriales bacterium]|nr:homoserine dehydrogenase [Flavobacteriales bacterium]